ncbi:MAG: hypothetical protein EAZ18_14765 [Oscillatoriales cyanobacterium]|nr:MAG: hypothetical protein EAZ18_14765 [Oscillatoriales cyanobacterium]
MADTLVEQAGQNRPDSLFKKIALQPTPQKAQTLVEQAGQPVQKNGARYEHRLLSFVPKSKIQNRKSKIHLT